MAYSTPRVTILFFFILRLINVPSSCLGLGSDSLVSDFFQTYFPRNFRLNFEILHIYIGAQLLFISSCQHHYKRCPLDTVIHYTFRVAGKRVSSNRTRVYTHIIAYKSKMVTLKCVQVVCARSTNAFSGEEFSEGTTFKLPALEKRWPRFGRPAFVLLPNHIRLVSPTYYNIYIII